MPVQPPNLLIRLVRSPIGYERSQKATVKALGLRRLQHEVERPDNGPIRGMIAKIQHLVDVRAAVPSEPAEAPPRPAPKRKDPLPADEAYALGQPVPPESGGSEPAPEADAPTGRKRRSRSATRSKEPADETA